MKCCNWGLCGGNPQEKRGLGKKGGSPGGGGVVNR